MAEKYNLKRHQLRAFVFYTVCTLQMILAAGCGSNNDGQATPQDIHPEGTDTASAHFSVLWHTSTNDATPAQTPTGKEIADCSTAGIAFVTCDVYDESNALIAGGGPWPCQDHSATVQKIPPGPDRTFVVLGWNASPDEGGAIVYQGSTSGIDLAAGEDADAGTIDANPFVPPEPYSTATYGNRIDLSWEDIAVPGVAGYHIYREGKEIATASLPGYSDTDISTENRYCYTVSAYDLYGHQSAQSNPLCQTTPLTCIYFRDIDLDSYGDPTDSIQADTQPPGYTEDNTDCNDNNELVYPNSNETCNGTDDDCDGSVDENLSHETTCGVGACAGNKGMVTCSEGQLIEDPCDPLAGETNEICDNIDNNCDGSVDEGCQTYYRDADEDTFGNPEISIRDTSQPTGYVPDNHDCNDGDPEVYPGAWEIVGDRIDNDCDGDMDEYSCYNNLPDMAIAYLGSYRSEDMSGRYYELAVTNSDSFPEELFTPSPYLTPCGKNTNASRTWIWIWNDGLETDAQTINGYCAFESAGNLRYLTFFTAADNPPPGSVYVEMHDRQCDIRYYSNYLDITDQPLSSNTYLDQRFPVTTGNSK